MSKRTVLSIHLNDVDDKSIIEFLKDVPKRDKGRIARAILHAHIDSQKNVTRLTARPALTASPAKLTMKVRDIETDEVSYIDIDPIA